MKERHGSTMTNSFVGKLPWSHSDTTNGEKYPAYGPNTLEGWQPAPYVGITEAGIIAAVNQLGKEKLITGLVLIHLQSAHQFARGGIEGDAIPPLVHTNMCALNGLGNTGGGIAPVFFGTTSKREREAHPRKSLFVPKGHALHSSHHHNLPTTAYTSIGTQQNREQCKSILVYNNCITRASGQSIC